MGTGILSINQVWMAVAVDADGTEGICAVYAPASGSWLPLLAADEARLPWMMEMAREVARERQALVRIVKMHGREELERIDGRQ
ncbi:hypothetical protein ACC806_34680 [Rhizobium ruizarguesonis]